MKYQFAYGQMTVTVRASSKEDAVKRATALLDKRCEKQNKEPPVAWALTCLRVYDGRSK